MCWRRGDRDYFILIAATVIYVVEYTLLSSQEKWNYFFLTGKHILFLKKFELQTFLFFKSVT